MKNTLSLATVFAMFVGSLLPRAASACANINVQSMNGTPQTASVGLTLDSVPADSLGVTLAPNGSQLSVLPVGGTYSPSLLHLAGQVTMGSLSASCSTTVTNDNVTGFCAGVPTPTYQLNILYVAATAGTPGTGSSTDDIDKCKHDNGNHWGEYRQLGLTVPPHSGKPGADCNKHHFKDNDEDDDDGGTGGSVGTPGTPASISCQFVLK